MTNFKVMRIAVALCIVFWVAVTLWAAEAWAEPRFNALDQADPLYWEYQRNLCSGYWSEYQRLAEARKNMDSIDPVTGTESLTREDWVIEYVVVTAMRDDVLADYQQNCLESAAP